MCDVQKREGPDPRNGYAPCSNPHLCWQVEHAYVGRAIVTGWFRSRHESRSAAYCKSELTHLPGGGPVPGVCEGADMHIRKQRSDETRTVLVLDRLGTFHSFAHEVLAPIGYRVLWGESLQEASSLLRAESVAALLVDVCVPPQGILDGAELMIRSETVGRVVVVTGCALMDAAARMLYPQADGFIQKPCSAEELRRQVAAGPEPLPAPVDLRLPFHGIIGTSPGIRRVIEQIHEVAPTQSTILITGETGTGKELVAAAIHARSRRSDRPYVVVDTVALSDTLLESELFGHTKGAFTGAVTSKPGLFEAADGGTVFLDEVGEIPTSVQFRLLRAIQEREVRRVGAVRPTKVDIRIIAATQWDLEEVVKSGRLRADLYYRLTVYNIRIPPLRERREDIPLLVKHALMESGPAGGRTGRCTDLALRMLECYEWPGNVRELLAVLEGGRISAANGRIAATDLPERIRVAWRETMLSGADSRERLAIVQALEETGGNRGRAAELLGVSRTTLWRWLARHGL